MPRWIQKSEPYPEYGGRFKKIGPAILRILANRSIVGDKAVDEFLDPSFDNCHPYGLMKDLEKAAELLATAIKESKKIRVIGDYDVDGVISTYILCTALKKAGADVGYRIPHRVTDGYGISDAMVEEAIADGVGLIVTCDNGISAFPQIARAIEAGITVIITDHHEPPEELPPAHAIVDPRQKDCGYPFKHLCGAGIAWKLVTALSAQLGEDPAESLQYVEFAAIATVCDIVELTGENRIIVKNGSKMIRNTKNIGLRALINACGLEGKPIGTYALGFIIGPSINASGRLEIADLAIDLLMCGTEEEAERSATVLRKLNTERQSLTEEGFRQAMAAIGRDSRHLDKIIVVYLPGVHESVAGIIASKVKESYNKPVIILTDSADELKGSGRSIDAYDMFAGLSACADLLDRFGGHTMAAGMSLRRDNESAFRTRLNNGCVLEDGHFERTLLIDALLAPEEITELFTTQVAALEPFGKGNRQPVFAIRHMTVERASVVGANRNTVKFLASHEKDFRFDAIQFGDPERFKSSVADDIFMKNVTGSEIDLAFCPEINEYNGKRSIQLMIRDIGRQKI